MEFKEKHAAFELELKGLLEKYNFALLVEAVYTDKLGNKHIFPEGQVITAQVRAAELATKPQEDAKPDGGTTEGESGKN